LRRASRVPAGPRRREVIVDPSTNIDARTRRTRGHASAAILAWMTFLLLCALTSGRPGRFTELRFVAEAVASVAR
jgi:hypothetical protein